VQLASFFQSLYVYHQDGWSCMHDIDHTPPTIPCIHLYTCLDSWNHALPSYVNYILCIVGCKHSIRMPLVGACTSWDTNPYINVKYSEFRHNFMHTWAFFFHSSYGNSTYKPSIIAMGVSNMFALYRDKLDAALSIFKRFIGLSTSTLHQWKPT